MKKSILFLAFVFISPFLTFDTSTAWQGRMAGMGDPYGLVDDESDFLIHPAMLSNSPITRYYTHYRYTYTNVMDWDLDYNYRNGYTAEVSYRASGDEQTHEALIGSTFSLGSGRMGTFFSYNGQYNDYNRTLNDEEFDFENEFDQFALRVIYGLPLNGISLGSEIGIAYQQEESSNYYPVLSMKNRIDIYGLSPYDSDYTEMFLKGSIRGNMGPIHNALTVRGGYIFSGDNEWEYSNAGYSVDQDGDVEGYRAGIEYWWSFPLCDGVTLPHFVRLDYQKKTRDGNGTDTLGVAHDYENTEETLILETGGGFERQCSQTGETIAAGIYFNLIRIKNDFEWNYSNLDLENSLLEEHRVIARFAWETPLSADVTLRTGMNGFYGIVEKEYKFRSVNVAVWEQEYLSKGSHWGVSGFLGCTLQSDGFSLEPFINGGYQELDLDGDYEYEITPQPRAYGDITESREKWFVGGGVSIIFGTKSK